MFCLETDSCRAVSRCFTSAEPKTLSCARSLAQEKDRVLRALFFTQAVCSAILPWTWLVLGLQHLSKQIDSVVLRSRARVLFCYVAGNRLLRLQNFALCALTCACFGFLSFLGFCRDFCLVCVPLRTLELPFCSLLHFSDEGTLDTFCSFFCSFKWVLKRFRVALLVLCEKTI